MNCSFFNNYSSTRNIKNGIWKIRNTNGETILGHKNVADVEVRRFEDLHKHHVGVNLVEVVVITSYLQIFIVDGKNIEHMKYLWTHTLFSKGKDIELGWLDN
jgi:hypothetical protein